MLGDIVLFTPLPLILWKIREIQNGGKEEKGVEKMKPAAEREKSAKFLWTAFPSFFPSGVVVVVRVDDEESYHKYSERRFIFLYV